MIASLGGHRNSVRTVAFSPDNKTLATAGADKTILLWDVFKNQELRRVGGPVLASSAAFSPDAKLLAALAQ